MSMTYRRVTDEVEAGRLGVSVGTEVDELNRARPRAISDRDAEPKPQHTGQFPMLLYKKQGKKIVDKRVGDQDALDAALAAGWHTHVEQGDGGEVVDHDPFTPGVQTAADVRAKAAKASKRK